MRILRREYFGGVFVDTDVGRVEPLDPDGYARKKAALEAARDSGEAVRLVDVSERGYPLLQDALSSPAKVYWALTDRCNGHCAHCFTDAGARRGDDEVTLAELTAVVDKLADCGVCYLRLTGGEPSLRPDFLEIVEAVAGRGIGVGVNTNGRVAPALLRGLLARGVRDIRVSLDGPEAANDALRGPGAFRDAMATLREIAAFNRTAARPASPTVNMTLTRSGRAHVGEMAALAQRLGATLSIGLLRPVGRADLAEMLLPEEVLEVAAAVQRLRRGMKSARIRTSFDVFGEKQPDGGFRPFPYDDSTCGLGALGFGLDPRARVVPCGYLSVVGDGRWLGEDLRTADPLEVWHGSQVLRAARRVRRAGCHGCVHHRRGCNGGCPVTALVATGDLDGEDPYCVRAAWERRRGSHDG